MGDWADAITEREGLEDEMLRKRRKGMRRFDGRWWQDGKD